jgi:energy-coupling factor transporter transmembrane protein EcfT
MNSKSLVGAVIGGLSLFVMGFIFYVLLLGDFLASQAAKEVLNFPFIILGEIIFGYLIVWVFTQNGTSGVSEGAKKGAMLGLLVSLGIGMLQYGDSNIRELNQHLVDAVVWAVRWAVAGAAVGWWLGRDS